MVFYFFRHTKPILIAESVISMENTQLKTTLVLIFAVLTIEISLHFLLVNPRLTESLQHLSTAQHHLDSVRQEVTRSRKAVDSIRISLLKFNNYLIAIQAKTEILFKEKELREAKFKIDRDSILAEIKSLYQTIDTLNLPPLQIYDSRK